jgi:glucose/arabinose dehydrogenase
MFTPLRRAVAAWLCALCTVFLFSNHSVIAQGLPTGFLQARTQNGYTAPMGVVFTPNGQQQFVWDKSGKVWVSTWNGSQYVKQATVALDISEEVGNWRDFGLLSVCLDPNFATNGKVYLFYMVDRHHLMNFGTASYSATTDTYYQATISRVTCYQLVNNNGTWSANTASRKVLLGETKSTGVPLTHESHAGGTLVFGRDGTLLLTTGDNASYSSTDKGSASETYFQQAINDGIMRANENVGSFRSQMPTSLCGKVLRMDPNTGDGIPSNPLYDAANPRSPQSRMWALGLRNPYRMGIQPNTGSTNPADGNPGTLLIGDVGWGVWEDFHAVRQGGENCGWPMFEGLEAHSGYMSAAQTLENRDEPNPSNTCNKPFLTFADLLKQPTNPVQTVTNPCSGQPLPGLQRRYIHTRPALDWNHSSDQARTPTFNGATATATLLGAAGGVPGASFRGNCATGGAYYAGTQFPTAWRNTYYFADYGANWIRAASLDANGAVTEVRTFLPNGGGNGIVDIEYNPLDGALYYININTGELMKISFGGNQPPVASISSTSLTGPSPLTVSFRGDASSDPDGDPLTYAWDFGDGTTSTLANPTKVFTGGVSQGFTVRLTVSDGRGLSDSKTVQVSINNPAPTAKITSPANNAVYPLGGDSQYTLTANVTDDAPASLTYAWQVTLRHNNHEHREPIINTASPTVVISPVGCDGETYYYVIKLTVTDRGGLTASDSVKIYPDCNSPSLAISNLLATPLINSARLNWTAPAITYDNVLVIAKLGSGFSTRPTELVYAQDASFTGSGATFEGGKVVYQGVATSLVVTNLMAGQRYFFRVYTRRGNAWTGGVETSTIPNGPAPVCGLSGAGLANVACNNNATTTVTTDDYVTFTLNPTGSNLGSSYSVSVSSGTVTPTTANYGAATTFRLQNGSAGTGNPTLIIRDATSGTCTVSVVVTNPGICSTSPTSTSLTPVANTCYRIVSRVSGKVMGVENGSTTDGGLIRQRTDANLASQQWKFVATSNGYYQIVANHSGKVIDVANASTADNATIHQWGWWGGNNQQWRLRYDAQGYYQIQGLQSGKMLDVQGSNQNEGGVITQFTANGTQAQQWSIEQRTCVNNSTTFSSTACYRITARNGGRAVSIPNGSTADGAQLRQQLYTGRASQQWRLTQNTEGFYQIRNVNSNKAIDVNGASTADYTNLIQWSSHGGTNQQWRITRDAQGFFVLTARHSGKAMDQRGANSAENVEIVQYSLNGTIAQQWVITAVGCAAPGARIGTELSVVPAFDSFAEPENSGFVLYPNPAQNSVNLDLRAAYSQPADVILTDLNGRTLYQKTVETAQENQHTISTVNYSDGVYLITVRVAEGPTKSLRLVIMR